MIAVKKIALLAALVLAGCATVKSWVHTESVSPPCDQPQCNYKIVVEGCSEDQIKSEFDVIRVAKGTHRIHWVITQGNYTFAQNGIALPGKPREFTNPDRVNPKEFSWTDTNDNKPGDKPKKFKYDINVVDSTGRVCKHDPSIVND